MGDRHRAARRGRAGVLGGRRLPRPRRPLARAALPGGLGRIAAPVRIAWRTATLAAAREETPTARTLAFAVEGWPGHRAGQHVDVRLTAEDGYQAERSYSIASAPGAPHLELTVERLDDGEVSPYLADGMQAGDALELRGPIGGPFTWAPGEGGPLLLVGGGSGVVPLMAMLRVREAAGDPVPATLLLSARTPADVYYREELARGSAEVVLTYTRVRPPGWTGYARRLDAAMLEEVAPPPTAWPRAFVCGPTPFVELAARSLVELGHDPARIRTERFGPS